MNLVCRSFSKFALIDMVREDGIAIAEAVALTLKKYGAIVSDVLRYFRKSPLAEVVEGKKVIPTQFPALIIGVICDYFLYGQSKPKSLRLILQPGIPSFQNTIPSMQCCSR